MESVTERDLIGDVPQELSREDGEKIEEFNFEDGQERTLFHERILTSDRLATMSGPAFLRPDVGRDGDYVVLRHYRNRLMRGELFLNTEDVIKVSKQYSGGAAELGSPAFPGCLYLEKVRNVIRISKEVEAGAIDGLDEARTISEIDLTKSEMTNFARAVAKAIR